VVAVRCISAKVGTGGRVSLAATHLILHQLLKQRFTNMPDKNLYIIAGCNGAGKTTASFTILPEMLDCREFVNADEIARGLSPFQPDTVAFEAGRIMLHRVDELLGRGVTFALETTLATKIYQQKIRTAQQQGYTVILLFFWLNSPGLAQERVKTRVVEGGHSIASEVIDRRYWLGINRLFNNYLPIVDEAMLFDNSNGESVLLARKLSNDFQVINNVLYQKLKNQYDSRAAT
jgi:predicted ABC-type ATPase